MSGMAETQRKTEKKKRNIKDSTGAAAKLLSHVVGNPGAPFWTQRRITEGWNISAHPVEYLKRRRARNAFLTGRNEHARVPADKGYMLLEKDLEGTPALLDFTSMLHKKTSEIVVDEHKGKKYLINLLTPEAYDSAQPLFDFILGDRVLELAFDYLGTVPQLEAIQVVWTPVNATTGGSQQYHLDFEGSSQLKFFVNLLDVTKESGPFSFLPKDVSDKVIRHEGKDLTRLEDEEVYRHCSAEDDVVQLIGERGTAAAVDTSRCLHFGARSRGAERMVLIFNFISHFLNLGKGRVGRIPSGYQVKGVRRMVLGLD